MKLTYLGTAAAEGFPAVFCNCKYCNEAKRLGGKNVRTRSQALINDDLLIDLPADTYSHFLANKIDADKIKYLFITHSHLDHLYPSELLMRHGAYAHDMQVPVLKLFCTETAAKEFKTPPQNVELNILKAFSTIELDEYKITPLPARHMPGGEALIYVIEGEKTLLYAHDTGYLYEEVFEYIEKSKLKFDMVSLDCTNVDLPITDEGNHMGFPNVGRVLFRLTEMGAVTDKTVKYVNHFSHNGNPIHELLENRAKEYGCAVSYDGCPVVF